MGVDGESACPHELGRWALIIGRDGWHALTPSSHSSYLMRAHQDDAIVSFSSFFLFRCYAWNSVYIFDGIGVDWRWNSVVLRRFGPGWNGRGMRWDFRCPRSLMKVSSGTCHTRYHAGSMGSCCYGWLPCMLGLVPFEERKVKTSRKSPTCAERTSLEAAQSSRGDERHPQTRLQRRRAL